MSRSSMGYQQLTLSDAAQTPAVPHGTSQVAVNAEGGVLRWRDDGVNPTAAVGMIIVEGDTLRLEGHPEGLRIFGGSGTKANLSYWG